MKRRGKKMKKFIKYGSIVVISLAILISCNVNSYDCDVFAEEKNETVALISLVFALIRVREL